MVKTHRFRPARNNISSVSLAKNIKHKNRYQTVLSKVDDFATFKKVEVHTKNSTF